MQLKLVNAGASDELLFLPWKVDYLSSKLGHDKLISSLSPSPWQRQEIVIFLKGKRSENKVLAAVKLVIYQARREIATRFLPAVHEITALRCTNTHIVSLLPGLSQHRVHRRSLFTIQMECSRDLLLFVRRPPPPPPPHHDPFELSTTELFRLVFPTRERGRT